MTFSAYPFENYMSTINKMVRGHRDVIQQISNRLAEFERLNHKFAPKEPMPKNRFLSVNGRDCYVGLNDFSLTIIIKIHNDTFTVQKYRNIKSFFQKPLYSDEVRIFEVSDLGETVKVTRDSIADKYVCFPYRDPYVLISLLSEF